MNINFVTTSNETLASHRYHNLIPAKELIKLGHKVSINLWPQDEFEYYIFSKHLNNAEYFYAHKLKSQGKKVIFHCCDNHFETKFKQYYRMMIGIADLVISSTKEMARIIEEKTGIKAVVIPDTYELNMAEPQFELCSSQILPKVLWFGHHSNLSGLIKLFPLDNIDLTICTTAGINLQGLNVVVWSLETLKNLLKLCNVVIIPSDITDRNIVKSHNRLIESVISGKFVIASPLPAYEEYRDWMYIGDVKKGLEWLKEQKADDIKKRIADCQQYIVTNYSREKIGKLWEMACGSL